MAIESERKFLVASEDWRHLVTHSVAIRQFYIVAGSDRSLRMRVKNGQEAKLTLKLGAAERNREEFAYSSTLSEAETMAQFALGDVIEKTRNIVPHDMLRFEVDEFAGPLSGLILAELETTEEVPDAYLPPWLGREVTGDARFYNANLALNGMPDITS